MKIKVILINLVVLLGLFLLIEIAARLFMAGNAPFSERQKVNLEYEPSAYAMRWMKPGQNIQHIEGTEGNPDKIKYRIGERGYRDGPELSEKKEQELRIAILGGSHVFDAFSYDFEEHFSFSKLLENKLNDAGIKSLVINAGIPGANTSDFVAQLMFELAHYELDYVIFNSAWNDIKWISKANKERQIIRFLPAGMHGNPFIEKVNAMDHLLGWSVVYRKIRDLYWRKRFKIDTNGMVEGISDRKKTKNDRTLGLKQYAINLESAILVAHSLDIQAIVAIEERLVSANNSERDKESIQYGMMNLSTHEDLVAYFSSIDSVCTALASKYDLPILDANSEVEGQARYFVDHIHTSPEGSEKIAQHYFQFFHDAISKSDTANRNSPDNEY